MHQQKRVLKETHETKDLCYDSVICHRSCVSNIHAVNTAFMVLSSQNQILAVVRNCVSLGMQCAFIA